MYKYVSVNEFVPHDDCIHLLKRDLQDSLICITVKQLQWFGFHNFEGSFWYNVLKMTNGNQLFVIGFHLKIYLGADWLFKKKKKILRPVFKIGMNKTFYWNKLVYGTLLPIQQSKYHSNNPVLYFSFQFDGVFLD